MTTSTEPQVDSRVDSIRYWLLYGLPVWVSVVLIYLGLSDWLPVSAGWFRRELFVVLPVLFVAWAFGAQRLYAGHADPPRRVSNWCLSMAIVFLIGGSNLAKPGWMYSPAYLRGFETTVVGSVFTVLGMTALVSSFVVFVRKTMMFRTEDKAPLRWQTNAVSVYCSLLLLGGMPLMVSVRSSWQTQGIVLLSIFVSFSAAGLCRRMFRDVDARPRLRGSGIELSCWFAFQAIVYRGWSTEISRSRELLERSLDADSILAAAHSFEILSWVWCAVFLTIAVAVPAIAGLWDAPGKGVAAAGGEVNSA